MAIYNAPIKGATELDSGLNTFTAKATISLKDVTNTINLVSFTDTPRITHFNNNISLVSQKKGVAAGDYNLIYSSGGTPYIFAGNKALKWTIDITSQDAAKMNVAGINSAGNLYFHGLNSAAKFRAAITASATGAHTVEVDGIKTGGRLYAGDIMGAIKVTAKGTGLWNTTATGINADYGATINKLGADITVSATKGKNSQNAYARGIYHASSNNSLSINTAITKKISATTKHSGTGNAYANGITGGVNIELAGVAKSGAITASATSNTGGAYASAIDSVSKGIQIMMIHGTVSASASAAGGPVEVKTIYGDNTLYIGDISGTVSATGKSKGGNSTVEAISAGTVTVKGEMTGNITANASVKGGSVSAYGIKGHSISNNYSRDTFGGKIQVRASQTDKSGTGDISAYGIYAEGNISFWGDFSTNITVNASSTSESDTVKAYGIFSQNADEYSSMYFSDIYGKISVNSTGAGYGICTNSEITEGSGDISMGYLPGSITVNANGDACGIEGYAIDFKSLTGTITAKSKAGNAFGLYAADGSISTQRFTQADLGKITVSSSSTDANHSAKAIYTTGILEMLDTYEITGDFTVTSKSYAYGIHAEEGIESGGRISVKMNVTGAFGAYAIKTDYSGIKPLNLWFVGAQITTKVTDKFCTGDQYAIRAMNTTNDTVWVAGKSKLTGKINLGNGNDTVMIYAGSKVTGAFEGVERVEFILDDTTQAGQTMWDKADESFGSTAMTIDLDYGTTGEFALCSRTSKDTAWSDIFNDDIQLNFGAGLDSKALNLGTATEIDGYSYEFKEKGNKLVLSVSLAN